MLCFYLFFALLSLAHLYACYFHIEKSRMATKPLLLLSLALFYVFGAHNFSWFILLALLCGMAGDIFLLVPGQGKCFTAGASVFGIGHVLYSVVLYSMLGAAGAALRIWFILLVALVYAAAVAAASAWMIPHIDKTFMKLSMPVYFGLVALVNVGAWLNFAASAKADAPDLLGVSLLVVGGVLFFVSDTILARGIFIREKEHMNFSVMLTYIAAQFCLCLGFIRYL